MMGTGNLFIIFSPSLVIAQPHHQWIFIEPYNFDVVVKIISIRFRYEFCNNVLSIIPGLTWLLVYRTENYQRLKNEVEKQTKKGEFDEFTSVSVCEEPIINRPSHLI